METSGGLDKVRLGGCGGFAGEDNGVVGKRGRLDDDLEYLAWDGIAHGLDFGLQILGAALDGQWDIDDHVHLFGAISNRAGRLSGLNLWLYGAGRKAHDGGNVQRIRNLDGQGGRGNADGVGAQLGRLIHQGAELIRGGLRLEQGVVDDGSNVGAGSHNCSP